MDNPNGYPQNAGPGLVQVSNGLGTSWVLPEGVPYKDILKDDILPDTQRSSTRLEELVTAQAAEIKKLRLEMDEIKALIKDSHSRQVNGAGYWDEQ